MSKHHSKEKHQGEGVKLVGSPKELINLLITDAAQNKWATEQIVNEGPKHKQVLSALMLKRLYKLVQTIEKSSGTSFAFQKGYDLIKENDEEETTLPVTMPINIGVGMDKKKVAEAISHAPEHEALAYAMCIQVIEWAIKTTAKK